MIGCTYYVCIHSCSYGLLIHVFSNRNIIILKAEMLYCYPIQYVYCFPDEIEYNLRHLPLAEEISACVIAGHYDEAIEIASQTESGTLTAALWACWLARSSLLARLLKLGLDPNRTDDAGR